MAKEVEPTILEALLERFRAGTTSSRRIEPTITEQIIIPGTKSPDQLFREAQIAQQEHRRNRKKQ